MTDHLPPPDATLPPPPQNNDFLPPPPTAIDPKVARRAEREAQKAQAKEAKAAARDVKRTELEARVAEHKAQRAAHKAEMAARPEWMKARMHEFGITVRDGKIKHRGTEGPLAGVVAQVETAGDIQSRFTATRLMAMGPFALAFKKKKDKRELYLTVEGEGIGIMEEVDPDKGAKARKFAVELTNLGRQAAADATPPDLVSDQPQVAPPTTPPPPAPAAAPSMSDQLKELAELHTAGVLTDEEFAAAKAKLLGNL